jgi:hypothetical protein
VSYLRRQDRRQPNPVDRRPGSDPIQVANRLPYAGDQRQCRQPCRLLGGLEPNLARHLAEGARVPSGATGRCPRRMRGSLESRTPFKRDGHIRWQLRACGERQSTLLEGESRCRPSAHIARCGRSLPARSLIQNDWARDRQICMASSTPRLLIADTAGRHRLVLGRVSVRRGSAGAELCGVSTQPGG